MTTIRAHFDGKAFIPDEPVNLPANTSLRLHIEDAATASIGTAADLLRSELVGLWADRKDIQDSTAWINAQRQAEQQRRNERQ